MKNIFFSDLFDSFLSVALRFFISCCDVKLLTCLMVELMTAALLQRKAWWCRGLQTTSNLLPTNVCVCLVCSYGSFPPRCRHVRARERRGKINNSSPLHQGKERRWFSVPVSLSAGRTQRIPVLSCGYDGLHGEKTAVCSDWHLHVVLFLSLRSLIYHSCATSVSAVWLASSPASVSVQASSSLLCFKGLIQPVKKSVDYVLMGRIWGPWIHPLLCFLKTYFLNSPFIFCILYDIYRSWFKQ